MHFLEAPLPDDAEPAPKTRVFLSYSRKDDAFTRRLAEALASRGYAPDFDQSARDPANVDTGIAAEEEWWQRLKDMIAAADVMVFVVSPDSAASKVCDEEIAYARALGQAHHPHPAAARWTSPGCRRGSPPSTSKIDFTDDGEAAFAAALDRLAAALDLDVAWHRESARLTLLAVRWEKAGRPDDLLLTAADVRAVGNLLERRPAAAPEPSAVLVDLRDASRAKLDAEETRQRRIIGRAFVKPAEEALKAGQAEHALRLAAAGALLARDLGFDPKRRYPALGACGTRDLREPDMRGAEGALRLRRGRGVQPRWPAHRDRVFRQQRAPLGCGDGQTDRRLARPYRRGAERGVQPRWPAHRDRVSGHSARIWDAATGKQIAALEGHTGMCTERGVQPRWPAHRDRV